MYYPTLKKIARNNWNTITLHLVFFSLITFQSSSIAAVKNQTAEEIRIEGYAEQQKGNLNSALAYYNKSLAIKPKQPQVLNDIGVVYEQMGQLERAEGKYLEAIHVDKNYLPAYLNLAYLYQKKGDNVKAIEYFEKRVAMGKPNDIWTQKAKEELDKIVVTLPGGKERIETRQTATIKKKADQLSQEVAVKAQKEWERKMKDSQEFFQKGQKLASERKYTKAIENFDKALNITPDQKEVIKAKESAKEELVREKIRVHIAHAMELLDLGDSASAKEEFRKILTIIPNEPVQKSE